MLFLNSELVMQNNLNNEQNLQQIQLKSTSWFMK